MYLDALTISALVDEFMDDLVGGRVQDVLDVDPTGFGLEVYAHRQRRYLYLSADRQLPRVHLVGDRLRRGLYKPTQLGLLFRRFVEGGIISHVSQPDWERILYIEIEHPAEGISTIVIEPMERRANILLLRENGVILDCVHRVGPENNRYRLSLPNHEYKLPPPLTDRFSPFEVTMSEIEAIFEEAEGKDKAYRPLSRNLLGFSPLLGREIIFRASGEANAKVRDVDPIAVHEAIQTVMAPLQQRNWQAGIAGEDGIAEAFSVYPLTYIPNWRTVESISHAMTTYYGAATGEEAYNQAKKPVQEALDEAKIKFSKKVEGLQNSLRDESELEHLQHSGELILAYQYTIEPGQIELKAQYEYDGPELSIKLDPDLDPVENAQRYFDKYNRAKRARNNVPRLITDAQNELNYILQLENDLHLAANWPDIDEVIRALEERGIAIQNKRVKRLGGGGKSGPKKVTNHDGYVIYIGRNSRQNEQVTFRIANSNDLWLHARDVPGAHVVIRNDGRRISEALIEQAASVAAYYSSKQADTKVDVDVTRCKYVKPIKSAGPGMVTYRNERTLTVVPQEETLLENS